MRAALAVALFGLFVGPGCDAEVATDCSGRSDRTCVDDGACWLTQEGCLPRCEEDSDCDDGSRCREVSLMKPPGVLEDNVWTSGHVCTSRALRIDGRTR